MISRQDMMNKNYSHREYYAQFVNDEVKEHLFNFISEEELMESTNEHFNDIELKRWDAITGFEFQGTYVAKTPKSILPISRNLLKRAGESVSAATLTCIYKEAAKQIREQGR